MWRAVESGGFVGNGRKNKESRNGGKPPRPGEPDIPGGGAEILRNYKKPNIQVYMQKNDLLCN